MKDNNPIVDFEAFMTLGGYQSIKQCETFLNQAKKHLREQLIDSPRKRHAFPKVNMVAKFVAVEVRKTNQEGLIEDILDYVKPELALSLLSLDGKKMKEVDQDTAASPFLLPATYYVRPNLNKVGKQHVKVRDYLFGGQSTESLLTEIKQVDEEQKELTHDYDKLKERIFDYPELIEKKKVATSFGSISRIAHSPTWDMESILNELGEDFITVFGKVNMAKLDEWILTGVIPKSILTRNREVHDIRLDFVVMALDVEERIVNFSNRRRSRLSRQREA